MRAGCLALAAVMIAAAGPSAMAGDTEPARAGREGRAELEAVLAKQRFDRKAGASRPATQPGPQKSEPRRGRGTVGKALPAVCVGCGAN